MKSVYWRPKKISGSTTLGIGILAVLVLWGVESSSWVGQQDDVQEQRKANELAARCRAQLLDERAERGLRVNSLFDPTQLHSGF